MWEKIKYYDFWDIPRLFTVKHDSKNYLFDCKFDEERDDYPDKFKVYIFENSEDCQRVGRDIVLDKNTVFLGTVNVQNMLFDATRRNEINDQAFECIEHSE